MREGIDVLSGGVVVHAATRPDVAWQNLRVAVIADEIVMSLDYAPYMTRCGEVESWAERRSAVVDSLHDADALTPDGEITVSYEDSFDELVNESHRHPRPDVDPWLAEPPTPVL